MANLFDQNWYRQFKSLIPTLLIAYSLIVAAIVGISFWAIFTGRRIWYFTSDPFILGNLPFYAGIFSTLGILFWSASATVCFFSAAIRGNEKLIGRYKRFLVMSGLITSLFLFDDLFQMHRIFFPEYFHIPIILVYCVYGLLGLWYLLFFRKQILETEYLMLALALSWLGLAVIIDILSIAPRGNTALSDFLKFFGMVSWFIYFTRTCWKILTGQKEKTSR
jgi:hypothetical protein